MELWIRSQNRKELLNVNNLAVIENRIVFINNGNGRATLGIYKSKERALEVLDEITSILKFKQSIALDNRINIRETLEQNFTEEQIDYVSRQMHVYEMPKD